MKKRILTRLGLLFVVATLGFSAIVWWTAPNHRINSASFERIAEGMSLAEVETILGCSDGDYCNGPAKIIIEKGVAGPTIWMNSKELNRQVEIIPDDNVEQSNWRNWIAPEGCIQIQFSADLKVEIMEFSEVEVDGFVDRCRRFLRSLR